VQQIYSAVIRPALTHGSSVWHTPAILEQEGQHKLKNVAAQLKGIQNKCLQVVAGAYKATPVAALETETHTPPLDLYLDAKLVKFRARHKDSGMEELVTKACAHVQAKLQRQHCRPKLSEEEHCIK